MTYSEATAKARELTVELVYEREAITRKAKEEGKWKPGLDTNDELFAESTARYMAKLDNLWNSIDDWEGRNFNHGSKKNDTHPRD